MSGRVRELIRLYQTPPERQCKQEKKILLDRAPEAKHLSASSDDSGFFSPERHSSSLEGGRRRTLAVDSDDAGNGLDEIDDVLSPLRKIGPKFSRSRKTRLEKKTPARCKVSAAGGTPFSPCDCCNPELGRRKTCACSLCCGTYQTTFVRVWPRNEERSAYLRVLKQLHFYGGQIQLHFLHHSLETRLEN